MTHALAQNRHPGVRWGELNLGRGPARTTIRLWNRRLRPLCVWAATIHLDPGRSIARPLGRKHVTRRSSKEHYRDEDVGIYDDLRADRKARIASAMSDSRSPASRASFRAFATISSNSRIEGASITLSTTVPSSPTTTNSVPGSSPIPRRIASGITT